MASSLNTPDVLTQPIAENGTKNAIPNTNDQSLGLVSQSTGFPAICSERIADGGKAPKRADFNGVFNLLSRYIFFKQNGGIETFRSAVSTAIGGYPLNAILMYQNGTDVRLVRSLMANNTYDFTATPSYIDDGTHWETVIPTKSWVTGNFVPLSGNASISDKKIFTGSIILHYSSSTQYEGFLYKTSNNSLNFGMLNVDNSAWNNYIIFTSGGGDKYISSQWFGCHRGIFDIGRR